MESAQLTNETGCFPYPCGFVGGQPQDMGGATASGLLGGRVLPLKTALHASQNWRTVPNLILGYLLGYLFVVTTLVVHSGE